MKNDPYSNQKLDAFEQSVEDSIGTDKWKPASKKTIKMIREAAKKPAIIVRENRESRINVRLKSDTLSGLRNKASELGMPYQTLASTVLHQFATGKFTLKISA